jgi:transglutaminase-like putative cysteine protease
MVMPIFLLGATILFWGWQTGQWILAVPMALAFEGSRLSRSRWDLADEDFRRILNFCLLLTLGLLTYLIVSQQWTQLLAIFLQWLPITFFPILLAQTYSTSPNLNLYTLFLFSRSQRLIPKTVRKPLDICYPYFVVCLLAASSTPFRDISFYIGMFVLSSLLLWQVRSRRFSPIVWICLLILAGSMGMVGQIGLHQLHIALEQKAVSWLSGFYRQDADPFRRQTSIGDLGTLKLSNQISFRVQPGAGTPMPQLLREATYNRYQSSLWVTVDGAFTALQPETPPTRWPLAESAVIQKLQAPRDPQSLTLTVQAALPKGQGLLKLPSGAFQVDALKALSLERNPYGTVKVQNDRPTLAYEIAFNPHFNGDSPPTPVDLEVPLLEELALDEVLNQLQITKYSESEISDREIVDRIKTFFQQNFSYSLDLTHTDTQVTPLSEFLLNKRSGHCEYFATGTTLLLREAGIPARYAIGFAVHEFSPLERQYVVRERNAHAWTLVYLDGAWETIDTTPGTWIALEKDAVPPWAVLGDLWSFLGFTLGNWRRYLSELGILKYWWLLLIGVILVALGQFGPRRRVQRVIAFGQGDTMGAIPQPGADSEFYQVEAVFDLKRNSSETFRSWLARLEESLPPEEFPADLPVILQLHYRYRFDPQGLSATERQQLRSQIEVWLRDCHAAGHKAK